MREIYCNEFVTNLISQATNVKDRYFPVTHSPITVGDLVLIKEPNRKPHDFPMGRVISIQSNDLGEVTGAVIKKGATGEQVKRHSSVIIPLLKCSEPVDNKSESEIASVNQTLPAGGVRRPQRAAAVASRQRSQAML